MGRGFDSLRSLNQQWGSASLNQQWGLGSLNQQWGLGSLNQQWVSARSTRIYRSKRA